MYDATNHINAYTVVGRELYISGGCGLGRTFEVQLALLQLLLYALIVKAHLKGYHLFLGLGVGHHDGSVNERFYGLGVVECHHDPLVRLALLAGR